MRVVDGGDRSFLYGGRFTGEVELEMLHATPTDDEPDTALVHFHDGAVSFTWGTTQWEDVSPL